MAAFDAQPLPYRLLHWSAIGRWRTVTRSAARWAFHGNNGASALNV